MENKIEKITLFFGKATGEIKQWQTGEVTLEEFYGNKLGDYNFGAVTVDITDVTQELMPFYRILNDKLQVELAGNVITLKDLSEVE